MRKTNSALYLLVYEGRWIGGKNNQTFFKRHFIMSYTKILKYREPTTNFESSIVDDFWRLAPSKGQLDAAYNRIDRAPWQPGILNMAYGNSSWRKSRQILCISLFMSRTLFNSRHLSSRRPTLGRYTVTCWRKQSMLILTVTIKENMIMKRRTTLQNKRRQFSTFIKLSKEEISYTLKSPKWSHCTSRRWVGLWKHSARG